MNIKAILRTLFFVLVLSCSFTLAQTSTSGAVSDAPSPSAKTPSVTWGIEERFRWESWNNVDANELVGDRRNQARFRTRMWTDIPLSTHGDFYIGLNNEFKKQVTSDQDLDPDEGVIEAAYLTLKTLGRKGLSLKAGRQSLMRGDGLILMDGTPLDGSRTFYLNAVDLSYDFHKSTLEIIGILDPKQDRFIPQINSKHKYLAEWDEQAIGTYFTNKSHKNTDVQAYYFYKKEVHDYRAVANPQFQPDRSFHTVGARVAQKFARNVEWTTEAAVQRGVQHPDRDVRGWALSTTLKKTIDVNRKPYVLVGYHAMSGDDSKTNAIEGWDPVFSRWPKWSDLLIYEYGKENGVSYWTNIKMFQLEAGAQVLPKMKVRATYFRLGAFHPFAGTPNIFSTGTHRGDLLQARTDYSLTSYLSGHFQFETLLPGDFYTRRDRGMFARAELTYSFHGGLKPWMQK